MTKFMKKFVKEESGAAIVEYGLALLVVASIAVGAFSFLGSETANNVAAACNALNAQNNCAPTN
ncbi:Flp family type IVb pilin [Ruegeria atlantica]|uniref:Flp family type IVb pilin n=1 Tax=Ruegeria atlantica TaxID=81569 RepID=UPI0024949687|nr:Flp family type IVb pilin [Ruegeria atlantica]